LEAHFEIKAVRPLRLTFPKSVVIISLTLENLIADSERIGYNGNADNKKALPELGRNGRAFSDFQPRSVFTRRAFFICLL
jgi:hypothetical protein